MSTGITLSRIGAWTVIIFGFWTILFLVMGIINLGQLKKLEAGDMSGKVGTGVVSLLFGGLFGFIGGIMILTSN